MSVHENDSEHIKVKKSNISNSDLMSTRYIGFNIVKVRKTALLGSVDKYTTTPIKNILIKARMSPKQIEIRT